MKKKLDTAQVKRAIDVVEAGLAVLSTMPKLADAYEECRALDNAARSILASLAHEHDASWDQSGDAHYLRLAGIQSSCTSGAGGLLHNWRNAAKRRLEAEAAR
ncbi:MAG: hypothetical protein EOS81_05470 [Mesorhizobium sp.]|uniref:hypothetical protein n=1 Tax=Mesorhizobium sp. TaxID=1871066 RepID=UPI000FD1BFA9|nr:hypothetical protein EN759_37490 [Mesorhizobium sp. M00.F.Ca.ET.038.03.1.1]RWF04672.1 MAG: hypothetical protein EOS81_05470 [Mesorhizobium sp.]TIV91489.1 MAG: hypothetical protein E5V77_22140 [Mesorhizobium sp.]